MRVIIQVVGWASTNIYPLVIEARLATKISPGTINKVIDLAWRCAASPISSTRPDPGVIAPPIHEIGVSDKLPSYGAARKVIMPTSMHCHERYANNRAEVSHGIHEPRSGRCDGSENGRCDDLNLPDRRNVF